MAAPGEIIDSRYRLDEVIGLGGMASVYRAWDLRLGRPVAVKLLRPEILLDADLALRFRREAHAATVLRHPNVVACLDTGTDRDSPFLVMELVEGEDLAARLRREPRLHASHATAIARDVARGLAIAHARGIVHRDVKPGNILLARDGRAMVTDFGIARVAAEAEGTLPGTTLGSVRYFSPEQAQGITTTPASDVYSLGLVLYEMLTGRRPFGGDSPAAIAIARVGAPPPSPRDVDPALSASLDAIVRRALAQDPADRYPNGAALADALEPLVGDPAVDPATATQRIAVPVAGSRVPGPVAPRQASRASTGLGAAAGVLVVVAVAVTAMLFGDEPDVAAIDRTPAPNPTALPRTSGGPASGTQAPLTTSTPTDPTDPPGPTALPAGTVADLCEPAGDTPCRLGPGTYRPSRFDPAFTVDLGDGWSTFRHAEQLVVFERAEGYLTLASDVSIVHDGDAANQLPSHARDLLGAIRDNDGLEILAEARVEIAGRRAVQLELVPTGGRTAVFSTGNDTYFAETTTVTRLIVFEIRNSPVFVILEGAGGSDLEAVAALAEEPLRSLEFD